MLSSLLALMGCGSAPDGAAEEVIVPTAVPATPTALAATAAVEYLSTITGDPPLKLATGLAVDRDGNIYIVETSTSSVKKFDWQGQLVKQWGGRGKGDGQFLFLGGGGIVIDPQGDVYVSDNGNKRIQKFDANGQFLLKWGSRGTKDGQFNDPFAISVDPQGNVYVLDSANYNVQKFDRTVSSWLGGAVAAPKMVSSTTRPI
jgi:streptogramin lyase